MSLIPFAGAVQKFNRSGGGAALQIERSLRFNSADSAYLSRTPASAGNRKTWTYSFWIKRSAITRQMLLGVYTSGDDVAVIEFDEKLSWYDYASATYRYQLVTTQVFRDVSAWYHMMFVLDTTQATDSNRNKIYINGSLVTALDTATYPSQNFDGKFNTAVQHSIGTEGSNLRLFLNGYQTETYFIDGQALTPSSFGEFNATTGVWQPKAYTGLYGTNGFYLDFSDNTSTTTLGYDAAGSNDWTLNNFSVTAGAGNDSLVDTPTPYGDDTGAGGEVRGNYATWNSLVNNSTLTNGNLQIAGKGSSVFYGSVGTIAISSGKWYWEITNVSNTDGMTGIIEASQAYAFAGATPSGTTYVGYQSRGYAYHANGNKYNNGSSSAYGATYTTNDIIGVAFDADAGTLVFYKNGASQGTAYTVSSGYSWFPADNVYVSDSKAVNFGQRPFAYTAPSGFKALCTQNLPEPTIVKANEYFDTLLWTGNGSNPRTLSGLNFAADMIWHKSRSSASMSSPAIQDAVRGFNTNNNLYTNLTASETEFQNRGVINSVSATGFTFNNNASDYSTADGLNENTQTFVAWNWKAGNSNVTNTDGTITSTVRANPTAGFSIVTYTGNLTSGATVGHGLGVAPAMVIQKNRITTDEPWFVYHASLGATKFLRFNGSDIAATNSAIWNDTAPSSTVVTLGNNPGVNGSSQGCVLYCFAAIPGYSAFGSYTGNNSNDGPFIYTGFRPAFFIAKDTVTSGTWMILDSERGAYNVIDKWLIASSSSAEQTSNQADFTSNGIKLRAANATAGPNNVDGNIYVYMAFAENPFKYSLAR